MKIIKYRPRCGFMLLCVAGVLLNGIGIGQSISRSQWTAALVSLTCSVLLIVLIASRIAGSYVTVIGKPADVGPEMMADIQEEPMSAAPQEADSASEQEQAIICAWPGCENRMSSDAQRLIEQYVRSNPTRGALFVLGNHPASDWLFVYGKGCFCERHWFLDPDGELCVPGPPEES